MIEYIGYLASVFIVLSFVFKNLMIVRLVNLLGCICFVIYALYITESILYPVLIPNLILAFIQIGFLINGYFKKNYE
ncbi:MAG: uroporphyrinogen decarboxylase [Bacteroidota bacterium]|nr:uroporphyrinogen decarboxylase [Bacteroidota bacterium]